jgi:hypothetical protein
LPIGTAPAGEPGAGGAQHEPVDQFTVAPPHELGDRATHRVADRHEAVDAELAGQRGDVVGTVLEPERLDRAQAAAMTAVVDGEHAEALGERVEAGVPVEVGGRRPAVQQDQHGRPRRPGELADERAAPTRQPHVPTGRQPRCGVWLSGFPAHPSPSWCNRANVVASDTCGDGHQFGP